MAIKKGKTKIEQEVDKKKEIAEDLDYLRQVELPESQGGGRKYVEDYEKDKAKKVKSGKDSIASSLQKNQGRMFTYRRSLASYGYEKLEEIDYPLGWEYYMIPTDGSNINIFGKAYKTQQGVLCIVKSASGDVYCRGIKVIGDALIDMNAIDILVEQVENTVDSAKGILLSDNIDTVSGLRKTKSGILISN